MVEGGALLDHGDARRIHRVREVRERHPFPIDAWVLLPDHLHCIWTLPLGDADCSRRWSLIKSTFRRYVEAGVYPQVGGGQRVVIIQDGFGG